MKPVLRAAVTGDIAALLELEQICFRWERIPRRQFRYLIARAKCDFRVLEQGGELAGYVLLFTPKPPRPSRLYSLAVHPRFRGQGFGSRLLDAALSLSDERGYSRCRLEVRSDDEATQAIYTGRGFVLLGQSAGYYEDGMDAFKMERRREAGLS